MHVRASTGAFDLALSAKKHRSPKTLGFVSCSKDKLGSHRNILMHVKHINFAILEL